MNFVKSIRNAGFFILFLLVLLPLSCSKSNPTSPVAPTPTPTFPSYSAGTSFGIGGGTSMTFPVGLGVSGDNVWVTNYTSPWVLQEWTTVGAYSESITDYGSSLTNFGVPWGVSVGPDDYIYVADQTNSQAVEFTPAGQFVTVFGKTELGTDFVTDVAVNSSSAYLVDYTSALVIGYNVSGTGPSKTFTHPVTFGSSLPVTLCVPSSATSILGPYAMCLDKSGNVYVTDANNSRVLKFNANGIYLSAFTTGLTSPTAVAVDSAGNLFVADASDDYIYPYKPTGDLQIPFLLGSECYGLALDSHGNLFASSYSNNEVVVFKRN